MGTSGDGHFRARLPPIGGVHPSGTPEGRGDPEKMWTPQEGKEGHPASMQACHLL